MKSAADFAHLELNGYRNINSIARITDKLHVSETLFGDLNAQVMILGQDGAPFSKIDALIMEEGILGYRHGPDVPTNKNLVECLAPYIQKQTGKIDFIPPKSCGVFYANSIWLLKETKGMSGVLPQERRALDVSQPVFKATIDGLSRLKLIIALGRTSYQSLTIASSMLMPDWREMVASRKIIEVVLFGKTLKVASVLHPSPRSGGRDVVALKKDFEVILRESGL